ncbi:bifunctional transcriptional activator/DNA repair enzyme AdaA [Parvularcula lutaonensis]|uniref:Bifunctional transcriptional activator/DNA repair enzyme AdaA n=1 Tax=Parvularcula lutaonensis TaxID=491923 RepID=A0ABV7MAP3_9PROT|nr:trifunctional transcriptional activator/DNA repair protein Ada/methylated-DNA--[protein]-cysteine S-methyltransferase [Parvularcula lutaonensis]GGY47389.1 6-O-methylguanine DNA methyltransferase [Parvularcula lutaonensis]
MLTTPLDKDRLYDALAARDEAYDGHAYVAVTTTGIFCRFACRARTPKRENVTFYQSPAECLEAGYRPCKRCKPMAAAGEREPLIAALLHALEAEPTRRWCERDIAALGHDPSTVRRLFRRNLGTTFLEMARLRRVKEGATTRKEGAAVIDAQLDAGFESASGFRAAFARLLGRTPGTIRQDAELVADFIDTPLGAMIAVADGRGLWLLEFADRKELPSELQAVEAQAGSEIGFGESAHLGRLRNELEAYFAGTSLAFSVPVTTYGTPWMKDVHKGLQAIPPGQTLSYKDLARKLDRPTAMRAVARANASNRLAIIVPCHRVIAADGKISGYAGGVWRKRWLLEHERTHTAG